MSLHFGIGFVLTPRPATPSTLAEVVVLGDVTVDAEWSRVTDDFAPHVRVAPEPVEEA